MGKRDKLKKLTTSWAGRTWSTGRMAASVGAHAVRRGLAATRDETQLGEHLVEQMDHMKGLVMKVGQMVSYLDGTLPPEAQRVMRKLQASSEPMDWAVVRAQVESAFGAPIDRLYDHLESEPLAAASIGQVHAGRHAGADVVVKVQYPGIAQTLDVDLGNLGRLGLLAKLGTAADARGLIRELRDRMREECDYAQEGANQIRFADLWDHDERVLIPRVHRDRVRPTVLTMDRVRGVSLYDLAESASQPELDRAGTLIFTVAFDTIFRHSLFNGDPHPGNYLFLDDGRVAFLDYGCVRYFPEEIMVHWKRIATTMLHNRRDQFRDVFMEAGFVGQERGWDWDAHWAIMNYLYKPFLTKDFRYTQDYVAKSYDLFFRDNPNLRKLDMEAPWLLVQRLQWGLNSVLAHLNASGPFGEIFRAAVETPVAQALPPDPLPSLPIG